ncbi:MAG: putative lipoprotein [Myxococcota bacterium]|jgi:predicted lipoprotein
MGGRAMLIGLLLTGCIQRGGDSDRVPTEVKDVLAGVGPAVVQPALARFAATTPALESALAEWTGAEATRAPAQAAWRAAMRAWQEVEAHQLGPTASSLTAVGGADLRDAVYSWPTVNPCRVDQETVAGGWDSASYFTGSLVNVTGLDALEHLLFIDGTANVCPSQVAINADGTWDALGDDGVRAARAAHAGALAAQLTRSSAELVQSWDGFSDTLAEAGTKGSTYDTADDGLNAIFDALFYLESATKDRKLAVPLGLDECDTATCPESVELAPSGLSTDAIAANLVGGRALFTGAEGAGLDDLLTELGHGDLADQVLAAFDDADAAVAAVDGPIDSVLSTDLAAVQALHSAVGALTDLLKGDLATVLALRVPAEAAGDND